MKGEKNGIYAGSLESEEKKFLVESEHAAVYVQPGYLLFHQSGTLMAQAFDAEKLRLSGQPSPLLQKVYFSPPLFGSRVVSASHDGTLSFLRGGMMGAIQRLDRSGKLMETIGDPGENLYNMALSPDGKRVVVSMGLPATDLWMYDIASGNRSRLTFDTEDDRTPIWSPDGEKILFGSTRAGGFNIYQKNSNGIGSDEPFLNSKNWILPDDWSPDGKYVLYEENDPKTNYNIWVLPTDSRKAFAFANEEANEAQARFSPDGRWIAYSSDESGSPEVYVRSFQQQSSGKWQVSLNGGFQPRWRRDGKELFYISLDKKLMSVEINAEVSFQFSKPRVLFKTIIEGIQIANFFSTFDPALDGQSFIVRTMLDRPEAMTILFNWPLLLKDARK